MRKAGPLELDILGTDLTWTTDEYNQLIGDALTVNLDRTYLKGESLTVRIYYRTSPDA